MASEETTNVMDWLKDIGIVVNSSKTEAMYFSKHDQDELKINVTSGGITVGTTLRRSWENNILQFSSIKNMPRENFYQTLAKPSCLILHMGQFFLYFTKLQALGSMKPCMKKLLKRLKVLSNATLVLGKKRQECSTKNFTALLTLRDSRITLVVFTKKFWLLKHAEISTTFQ